MGEVPAHADSRSIWSAEELQQLKARVRNERCAPAGQEKVETVAQSQPAGLAPAAAVHMCTDYMMGTWAAMRSLVDATGREVAEMFVELPDRKTYPDYFNFTRNPISLRMIRDRIENSLYPTCERFEQDVQTMINNCRAFNSRDLLVFQDAEMLENMFLQCKRMKRRNRGFS
jgi:hypothetical protein